MSKGRATECPVHVYHYPEPLFAVKEEKSQRVEQEIAAF
jgi:hypothetical protein